MNKAKQNKTKYAKITGLSFGLSYLIVWVHNGLICNGNENTLFLCLIAQFDAKLHQVLTFVVPMYFLISGFLFFNNLDSIRKLIKKIKSRIYSLGIPFILWNIVAYLTIYICVKIDLFDAETISGGIINAVINSSCSDLWFLRYLMVCVAISPLLYFLMKNRIMAWFTLCGAIIIKFVFVTSIPVFPSYYLPVYMFGGIMAMHYKEEFLKPNIIVKRGTFILFCVMLIFAIVTNFQIGTWRMSFYGLLMPIAVWFTLDTFMHIMNKCYVIKEWMSVNFFIYINHFNLMRIIFKMLSRYNITPGTSFILYIFIPNIVFGALLLIGIFWKRQFPRGWQFVNGGR